MSEETPNGVASRPHRTSAGYSILDDQFRCYCDRSQSFHGHALIILCVWYYYSRLLEVI